MCVCVCVFHSRARAHRLCGNICCFYYLHDGRGSKLKRLGKSNTQKEPTRSRRLPLRNLQHANPRGAPPVLQDGGCAARRDQAGSLHTWLHKAAWKCVWALRTALITAFLEQQSLSYPLPPAPLPRHNDTPCSLSDIKSHCPKATPCVILFSWNPPLETFCRCQNACVCVCVCFVT